MPGRLLTSRVLRWPDAEAVTRAAREWATTLAQTRGDVVGIGYIGSYARGDWGVGSDLDVVIVLENAREPFHERALGFDTPRLPVPVDLLIYTAAEWKKLRRERTRFATMLEQELRWLYSPDPLEKLGSAKRSRGTRKTNFR